MDRGQIPLGNVVAIVIVVCASTIATRAQVPATSALAPGATVLSDEFSWC